MSDQEDTIVSPSSVQAPSNTITPTHFQHRTTSAAPTNSLIDTATPAINAVPIELDSTPVTLNATDSSSKPSLASGAGAAESGPSGIKSKIQGVVAGAEQKVQQMLGSSNQMAAGSSQDSSKLRVDDAAVMAGPPGTPGPEDFEAAGGHMVTPS